FRAGARYFAAMRGPGARCGRLGGSIERAAARIALNPGSGYLHDHPGHLRLDIRRLEVYIHDMDRTKAIASTARMLLEHCMCHKTRMAARSVTRAYDDALRSTGLRATQIAVLAAVGASGALSIQALARSMAMDRTTLTRNLRPLEDRGLVTLAPEARFRSRM